MVKLFTYSLATPYVIFYRWLIINCQNKRLDMCQDLKRWFLYHSIVLMFYKHALLIHDTKCVCLMFYVILRFLYTIPVILNHFSWKSNPCSQQADSFRITCKTRLIFSAFYALIIFHSFSAVCGRLKKLNFLIASWIDFMVLYVPDNENACQKWPKICRYWP